MSRTTHKQSTCHLDHVQLRFRRRRELPSHFPSAMSLSRSPTWRCGMFHYYYYFEYSIDFGMDNFFTTLDDYYLAGCLDVRCQKSFMHTADLHWSIIIVRAIRILYLWQRPLPTTQLQNQYTLHVLSFSFILLIILYFFWLMHSMYCISSLVANAFEPCSWRQFTVTRDQNSRARASAKMLLLFGTRLYFYHGEFFFSSHLFLLLLFIFHLFLFQLLSNIKTVT